MGLERKAIHQMTCHILDDRRHPTHVIDLGTALPRDKLYMRVWPDAGEMVS